MKPKFLFVHYTETQYEGYSTPEYFKSLKELKQHMLDKHSDYRDQIHIDVIELKTGNEIFFTWFDNSRDPESNIHRLDYEMELKKFTGA